MDDNAVTFDFHNTLAECPAWFDLEVKHLASSFLGWWSRGDGHAIPDATLHEADDRYRQLRREIMDHGNELTAEQSLEQVFRAMGIAVPDDVVVHGVEHLMRETLAGTTPIPGAVETVRDLADRGLTMGVISSAVYHPFLEWTLDAFGIRDAFRAIVTSASAGFYKSRPEIYWHAAEAIGADPARTVHVGDSLRFDVGGAREAGMGTVWLQHEQARPVDSAIIPDLTLQTLVASSPKLIRLLETRNGQRNRA
jgi:HAD superfamily hydrolase (TIGR01509 family)